MAVIMSFMRRSSDLDVDLLNLKLALDHIQSQVQVPYSERRRKAKGLKLDPDKELLEVIEELNGRETELNAAVGIAKMLMEKMNYAQENVKYIYGELELAESRNRILEADLETLRQTHEATEKENAANLKGLEALELQMTELVQENAGLLKKAVQRKSKAKTKTLATREAVAIELDAIVAEKEAAQADLESEI